MNIQEIIENLKNSDSSGFQIENRKGILCSTWLIYKRKNKLYYFDINDKIEFIEQFCYTETELFEKFSNANFKIEEFIN